MLVGNGQVSDFLTTSQLVSPPLESMDIGKISLARKKCLRQSEISIFDHHAKWPRPIFNQ